MEKNIEAKEVRCVVVKDKQGNPNIWSIIGEFVTEGQEVYRIQTRITTSIIEKALCFVKYGYSLLYYENENNLIDVNSSNIDLEAEENQLDCDPCIYYDSCDEAWDLNECDLYCNDEIIEEMKEREYKDCLRERQKEYTKVINDIVGGD